LNKIEHFRGAPTRLQKSIPDKGSQSQLETNTKSNQRKQNTD